MFLARLRRDISLEIAEWREQRRLRYSARDPGWRQKRPELEHAYFLRTKCVTSQKLTARNISN